MEIKELIVEISRNCNLACAMCGFGGQPINKEWFMDRTLLDKVLRELGAGVKVIRLNGRGESTIHPDFRELVALVRSSCPDASLHLFTNLSYRRPEIIDLFIVNKFQLFISVDSPDDGLLAQIRRGCRPGWVRGNLDALKSLDVRPFIVATLQERNLHQVVDMARFAVRCNCHLIFNTVRYDVGSPEFDRMICDRQEKLIHDFSIATALLRDCGLQCCCPDQMHGIKTAIQPGSTQTTGGGAVCPSLHRELFISFDGSVHPCNMFHPYVLGDLQTRSIKEIRLDSRWSWFAEHHFETDYCRNCAYIRAEVQGK